MAEQATTYKREVVQPGNVIERMCRAASDATIIGPQYRDPKARASKVDECWQSWEVAMIAAFKAARQPVGDINVPSDIEQYGLNHGIPEFANAIYRAGYIDGHRAALGQPEDVMARVRRGETVTLAELTSDD